MRISLVLQLPKKVTKKHCEMTVLRGIYVNVRTGLCLSFVGFFLMQPFHTIHSQCAIVCCNFATCRRGAFLLNKKWS